MANDQPSFLPRKTYHIFNHAVGAINLFKSQKNFQYFLKKYDQYISPIAFTYAYCLLPNHFHFLIQIKDFGTLAAFFECSDPQGFENPEGLDLIHRKISHQFGNLQNSYAKAYNKAFRRTGSVFEESIQRRSISHRSYFFNALHYIHQNPVYHGLVADIQEWTFTSWHSYVTEKPSKISANHVLEAFQDLNTFKNEQREKTGLEKYALDMELQY